MSTHANAAEKSLEYSIQWIYAPNPYLPTTTKEVVPHFARNDVEHCFSGQVITDEL
jgi:hypothetical protein